MAYLIAFIVAAIAYVAFQPAPPSQERPTIDDFKTPSNEGGKGIRIVWGHGPVSPYQAYLGQLRTEKNMVTTDKK